jgi:hypothetical protein
MKCIKVVDGDIAVGGDGKPVMVEGAARIRQELALWLLEPMGTDRVYPKFGSDLWNYIGTPAFDDNLTGIKSEVNRVVTNYIAAQNEQIAKDKQRLSDNEFLQVWTDDDIVSTLNSITVSATGTNVNVLVILSTAAATQVSVEQTL